MLMIPLFGSPLSPEYKRGRLKGILRSCPKFYPALLELGLHELAAGTGAAAERRIDQGLGLMLELAEPEHLPEELDALVDNLERLWRYDLCRRCLEPSIEKCPGNAKLRDSLACAAAQMGDVGDALRFIDEALETEPRNPLFTSNKGWILLMAGDLKAAGRFIKAALRLQEHSDAETSAEANLEIHRYLTRHGGSSYLDFLLRPADREELERLADDEEWEQVDRLRSSYNHCRQEAMALTILRENKRKRSRLADLLSTIEQFFAFVRQVDQDGLMLDEDLSFIHVHFKPIMHKFIVKFGDIDVEMFEEICQSLFEYYGFLSRSGIVPAAELSRFKKEILGLKAELNDKIRRYNAIRHDDGMDEDDKEAIRQELFEGDHAWPHL